MRDFVYKVKNFILQVMGNSKSLNRHDQIYVFEKSLLGIMSKIRLRVKMVNSVMFYVNQSMNG